MTKILTTFCFLFSIISLGAARDPIRLTHGPMRATPQLKVYGFGDELLIPENFLSGTASPKENLLKFQSL